MEASPPIENISFVQNISATDCNNNQILQSPLPQSNQDVIQHMNESVTIAYDVSQNENTDENSDIDKDQSFMNYSECCWSINDNICSKYCKSDEIIAHIIVEHIEKQDYKFMNCCWIPCQNNKHHFETQNNLIAHLIEHFSEFTFNSKCPDCQEHFSDIEKFVKHRKIHTKDIFRMSCTHCIKNIVYYSNQNKNSMYDSLKKPNNYTCPEPDCHKNFISFKNCEKHFKRHEHYKHSKITHEMKSKSDVSNVCKDKPSVDEDKTYNDMCKEIFDQNGVEEQPSTTEETSNSSGEECMKNSHSILGCSPSALDFTENTPSVPSTPTSAFECMDNLPSIPIPLPSTLESTENLPSIPGSLPSTMTFTRNIPSIATSLQPTFESTENIRSIPICLPTTLESTENLLPKQGSLPPDFEPMDNLPSIPISLPSTMKFTGNIPSIATSFPSAFEFTDYLRSIPGSLTSTFEITENLLSIPKSSPSTLESAENLLTKQGSLPPDFEHMDNLSRIPISLPSTLESAQNLPSNQVSSPSTLESAENLPSKPVSLPPDFEAMDNLPSIPGQSPSAFRVSNKHLASLAFLISDVPRDYNAQFKNKVEHYSRNQFVVAQAKIPKSPWSDQNSLETRVTQIAENNSRMSLTNFALSVAHEPQYRGYVPRSANQLIVSPHGNNRINNMQYRTNSLANFAQSVSSMPQHRGYIPTPRMEIQPTTMPSNSPSAIINLVMDLPEIFLPITLKLLRYEYI